MPRSSHKKDKSYAELLIAASIHWLSQPPDDRPQIPGLKLAALKSDRANLSIKAESSEVLVELIAACAKYYPTFRATQAANLALPQLPQALRDAVSTIRNYGLDPRARFGSSQPEKNQRDRTRDLELNLAADLTQPKNHGYILERLFGPNGEWEHGKEYAAKEPDKLRTGKSLAPQPLTPEACAQQQLHFNHLLTWLNTHLLPEKLHLYSPVKAQALDQLIPLLTPNSVLSPTPDLAQLLNKLAIFYLFQNQLLQAQTEAQISIFQALHAKSFRLLGVIHQKRYDFPLAEKFYLEALQNLSPLHPDPHPDLAELLLDIAQLYIELDHSDTQSYLDRAHQAHTTLYGESHSATAQVLNAIAHHHRQQGDLTIAIDLYEKVAIIDPIPPETFSGLLPHSPLTPNNHRAIAWKGLGDLHLRQEQPKKAEIYYKQAIQEITTCYGPEHPYVAITEASLAGLYQHYGSYDIANLLYRHAIELLVKIYGDRHPLVGEFLSDFSHLLQHTDPDAATKMLQQAHRILAPS
jgi:hypothetical protein